MTAETRGGLQAIVLAAGVGRRMLPLSANRHKALLPVGGTTILARIVDSLLAVGVRDVTVATGYRSWEVRSYLEQHYPGTAFQFVENPRYATTNNVVSLALVLEQASIENDVLLLECDLLFHQSLLERVVERRGNIALVDRYRTGMDGTVVSLNGGEVTGVFPPQLQGPDFSYVDKYKTLNIYRFDRDFCLGTLAPLVSLYANKIDATSYYELVLSMLVNLGSHAIAAEVVDGDEWAEVDDPNDLAVAKFRFEPSTRSELLEHSHGGWWGLGVEDAELMRNVHFPTPAMLAELRHALPELLKGYGSAQAILDKKLALFLECAPGHVHVLNGASQAFPILAEIFEGRPAALPHPTFGEFARAFPGASQYPDRPGVDLADLERLAGAVEVLVVVNPNSPTGTTLGTERLYRLARSHPRTTFVVDESFVAFSPERPLLELLEREPLENVAVLASLSKVLGVPGLRLGYLYSHDEALLSAVGQRLPVWGISSLAEHFLELLPKFRPELARSIERTAGERDALASMLREVPGVVEVTPSGGNFLLTRLDGPPGRAAQARRRLLEEHSLVVKDVSARFDDGVARLRVAVRSHEDNRRLVGLLRAVLEPPAGPTSPTAVPA